MNFSKLLFFTTISLCSLLFAESKIQPDLEAYHKKIKPILSKYCYDCHGKEKQKADIRLDNIDPNILSGDQAGMWEDVRETFNIGEMPPKKKKQALEIVKTTENTTLVILEPLGSISVRASEPGKHNAKLNFLTLARCF